MSRISSPNLDVLKRPRVLVAMGVVVVLIIAFYFAWWSPESSKLSSVNAQGSAEQTKIQTLTSTLAVLRRDNAVVRHDQQYLGYFATEIPSLPEQGELVSLIGQQLAKTDNVDVTSFSASTTAPPAAGSSLSTIPITLSVTGPHEDIIKFLAGLYTMPRLVTIQSIDPSPSGVGGSGTTYNVLGRDNVTFTVSVTATAYFVAPVGVAVTP